MEWALMVLMIAGPNNPAFSVTSWPSEEVCIRLKDATFALARQGGIGRVSAACIPIPIPDAFRIEPQAPQGPNEKG